MYHEKQVPLVFNADVVGPDVHLDISAMARSEGVLFLACDETRGIERLVPTADGWGRHEHIALDQYFDLPDKDEIDIEGLAVDQDWLWITGSHARKRSRPKELGKCALKDLRKTKFDQNRQFLGRLPLATDDGGARPVKRDGDRRAACMKLTKEGRLREWLAEDALLGAFVDIPSKENGLDVEGIAACGDRVWLGLRGPVLAGHAIILELHMKVTGKHRIKPRQIDGDRRYRVHVLPLGGEGVRDLSIDGDDLLILTGTPLAADGASAVMRWRGAASTEAFGVRASGEISIAKALPYRGNTDNPEALCRWDDGRWLIAHDNPGAHRLGTGRPVLHADLWDLTDRATGQ